MMKYYSAIFSLLFFFSCSVKHDLMNMSYQIIDIENVKQDIYIVYASRNDSLFQIVSPCISGQKEKVRDTIKIGHSYQLCLVPLFETEDKRDKIVLLSPLHRGGIGFRGETIKINKRSPKQQHELYITNYLNGRCLIRPSKQDPLLRFWNSTK